MINLESVLLPILYIALLFPVIVTVCYILVGLIVLFSLTLMSMLYPYFTCECLEFLIEKKWEQIILDKKELEDLIIGIVCFIIFLTGFINILMPVTLFTVIFILLIIYEEMKSFLLLLKEKVLVLKNKVKSFKGIKIL